MPQISPILTALTHRGMPCWLAGAAGYIPRWDTSLLKVTIQLLTWPGVD